MNYDDSGEFQNYKIVSIKIVSSSSLSLSLALNTLTPEVYCFRLKLI